MHSSVPVAWQADPKPGCLLTGLQALPAGARYSSDISRTCAECFVLCSLTLSSLCHLWGSCSALGVDIVGTVCFTSVYFIPAELQDVMFTLGKPSALPAHAWPAWIYHWAARERNAAAGKASGRREQKGNTLLGEQPSALLGSGRSPAVLPVRRGSLEQR